MTGTARKPRRSSNNRDYHRRKISGRSLTYGLTYGRIRRRHFFRIGKCRGSEIVVEVLLFLESADPAVKKTARRERQVSVSVPRFRVSARIVDGHIQFHRIFVDALITLDQVKLLGRGMPHLVEPYLPV